MSTFEVGQEVVILDGTSLIGIVSAKEMRGNLGEFYAVKLNGYGGRWYRADDLATATPTGAPAAAGAGDDYAKGYNAGLLDGYAGNDTDWVTRYENNLAAATKLAQVNADLLANAQHELAAARQALAEAARERDAAVDLLRDIARNAPQEQPHANEQWKWTFWFAGSLAKSCVDTLATNAQAASADGEGG